MTDRLVICAPLGIEARAVRKGLRGAGADDVTVLRAGYGPQRARRQATALRDEPYGMIGVAGVGAGLTTDAKPGDLVVATEIRTDGGDNTITCPAAPLLAGELRRAGLRVHTGPIVTVDHLVSGADRARLAATGAVAADMESAELVAAANGRPVAVIRAISDGPGHRLVHPATVTGGLAALRALRAVGPVLRRWAAAVPAQGTERQVLLAGPRSFCAGVERAIEIVERVLDQQGPPVYVRKQIVHNKRVVTDLEGRGAIFVDELDEVPDGATVVFSAHGVAPAVRDVAAQRGLATVDATCPLVSKVHAEARRFADNGYLVALIGHAGHEEVEGTLGEAPQSTVLVQTAADVADLVPPQDNKIAYLMQTTLAIDEASEMADAITSRFPQVRGPRSDDICYATTNRQNAVRAVAAEADLVLVAGSANSSNSVRLVERSVRAGTPAHLIDGADDIELSWLEGVGTVGLTAGASAPPAVVEEIIAALGGLGPVQTSERVVTTESIRFGLPREVRQK
ncbi:MAG TPA: 4-hydroxy-3-methylbut-2-enyl diphosphate reductase [Streptosporangiaceae bacterium]|jgi:4-hydroxy-3-methylbut-2-enyl diphosphate reductase